MKHTPPTLFIKLYREFVRPRSKNPVDVFREQTLRMIVSLVLVFFLLNAIFEYIESGFIWVSFAWYVAILLISAVILTALQSGRLGLATWFLPLSLLIIITDPSAAYWSPGTIILSLIFTLIFQLLIPNRRERIIVMVMNLGVYGWVWLNSPGSSPLMDLDYFSEPHTALFTMFTAHFIVAGMTIIIRREQEKRNQVALMLEQQRSDSLYQLISHISHDLRTPLTKMNLKLYMIRKHLMPEQHHYVDDVEAYVSDLNGMITAMIELSLLDALQQFSLQRVQLNPFIRDMLQEYQSRAADKHIQLTSDLPGALIIASISPHYLILAVGNVLDNAIYFTPPGGKIHVRLLQDQTRIQIQVSDTGIGIPPEQQPYIFDRFYRGDASRNQSERGGNGLGLAITRRVMELHGGSVSVDSVVGQGSTFTLTL